MKQYKADLHMHSRWSDGSLDMKDLLRLGSKEKIEIMAVTDHDTLEGQDEALEEGLNLGITVIPGIEISAFNPKTNRKVHILGYCIKNTDRVNKTLRPYLMERNQATMDAVKIIQEAGYPIELADVQRHANRRGIIYRQHIMHALADRGYCLSIYGDLYQKFFGKNGIAKLTGSYITADKAVKLIKECGGFAVLAHPFQYDSIDLVKPLCDVGLDGIEAIHPTQTREQSNVIKEIAVEHGLFLTGGSDAHGFYTERIDPLGSVGFTMDRRHPLLENEI